MLDSEGRPDIGGLFHVIKTVGGGDSGVCTGPGPALSCERVLNSKETEPPEPCVGTAQGGTQWELWKSFKLSDSKSLLDWFCFDDTEVSDVIVYSACEHVSQHRQFTVVTRNCQEWVKEVITHLVEKGHAPKTVLKQMKLQGFVTLKNKPAASSTGSSFSLKCWGK